MNQNVLIYIIDADCPTRKHFPPKKKEKKEKLFLSCPSQRTKIQLLWWSAILQFLYQEWIPPSYHFCEVSIGLYIQDEE